MILVYILNEKLIHQVFWMLIYKCQLKAFRYPKKIFILIILYLYRIFHRFFYNISTVIKIIYPPPKKNNFTSDDDLGWKLVESNKSWITYLSYQYCYTPYTHTRVHVRARTHTHTHTRARAHTHTHTHIYVCIYIIKNGRQEFLYAFFFSISFWRTRCCNCYCRRFKKCSKFLLG